ncbi:MAG TPA: carbohydrate-binding protein [Candidatus Acidoferrum sp.]|nr:carbohydrate-binding protein [Candidatus Acidoferrum sp.]
MPVKELKFLLAVALCINSSRSESTRAEARLNPRWDALNEPGNMGRVEAVAVSPYNPNVILAGGDILGVGLSTNGGVSWEQTIGITQCSEINDFTFDPSRSNIVWVGTLSGPYRSTDGGKTWTLKRAGMPPMSRTTITAPIQKVLFDPNDSNTLLAIAGNHRHMGYGVNGTTCWGGVWKSTDAGENWTRLTTIDDAAVGAAGDGTGVLINDAGFAAGSSKTVYACSDKGGVYKSTDAGASFGKANDGLPNTEAWALALHPTEPDTLWVSLGGSGAIYKSTDGARTWRNSSLGIATNAAKPTEFRTVAVARSNPNYLYCAAWNRPASAYRSIDGGTTWAKIVDNGSKSTLVGGTGDPSIFAFQWLSVDPNHPSHAAGACEGKVVQSFDAGATWKDITGFAAGSGWRGNGYGGLCCTAIAWNPYKPGQVFTLGMDGGKLLRSDDGLWSWKLADAGLFGPFNGANDVAFAADGTVYVASGQFGNIAGAYLNEPIIKSTNWGATWAYTVRPSGAKGDNKAVWVDPNDSRRLWAIMGNVLYQSRDGAGTWTPLMLNDSGNLWNLAADPRDTNAIYVGAQHGVFKTTDGTNFSLMRGSPTSSNFEYVYVDPVTTGVVYAVSFNSGSLGGVYRYGGSWTRVFKKAQVRALAVDPGNPQRMAVVTKWWPARDVSEADGVWVSMDGGGNWEQCNDNLRMLRGTTIAFNPDKSGQLILGTDGAGFYVTDLGASSALSKPVPTIPGTIQAERYNTRGEDGAYHRKTNGTPRPDPFRTDAVDARAVGRGRVVCNLAAGDWLKYSVHVTQPGSYEVTVHLASARGEGAFHLEANGVNVTGPVAVTAGGRKTWTDIVVRKVRLAAGPQQLKLCVEAAGADIDYIRFIVSDQ